MNGIDLNNVQLFIFDMDGTLFEGENFWLDLHKEYGTGKDAYDFFKKNRGEDYKKVFKIMSEKYWKNISAEKYFSLVINRKYNDSVVSLHGFVKSLGIKTALISSGPMDLAKRAQADLDIDYIYANQLIIWKNRFTGECVVNVDDKKKYQIANDLRNKLGLSWSTVGLIGDGENDIEIAKSVGLSISYDSSSQELNEVSSIVANRSILHDLLKITADSLNVNDHHFNKYDFVQFDVF